MVQKAIATGPGEDTIHVEMTAEDEEALIAVRATADAKAASVQYLVLRKEAYGTIENQLQMIYQDRIDGTNIWEDLRTQADLDFPTPAIVPATP